MLLGPLPWTPRLGAVPFLPCGCPSQPYDEQRGRAHRTLTDRARQLRLRDARWLPGRDVGGTAESRCAAWALRAAGRAQVAGVTRRRLDAALYEPAPARQAQQPGRPRQNGRRWPTLPPVAPAKATRWPRVTVRGWYGERERPGETVSGPCVWSHTGMPAGPMRWVLSRAPEGKFETPALLCTRLAATSWPVVEGCGVRWPVAGTCEEARAHLGMETQRPWSAKAVARTTPGVLGL